MYAIVKTGGKQYKVAEGDLLKVERLSESPGEKVNFETVLLVNDGEVTSDVKALEKIKVSAQIMEHVKGPKIKIHKFKNKTGYHKRQGHRQPLTVVKIDKIK